MPLIRTEMPEAWKCPSCNTPHNLREVLDPNAPSATVSCPECNDRFVLTPGAFGWRYPKAVKVDVPVQSEFPKAFKCPSCAQVFLGMDKAIPNDAKEATFCCIKCGGRYNLRPHKLQGWSVPQATERPDYA